MTSRALPMLAGAIDAARSAPREPDILAGIVRQGRSMRIAG